MFSRLVKRTAQSLFILALVLSGSISSSFAAAPAIPFTVTMSEAVNISGTPRIILDVGGTTRYATYSAGTGTSSLTFTYTATLGDLDLDGIGIASTTLDLNGGNVTDLNGNPETNLTFVAPANMSSVKVSYPSLSMDFVVDSDGRFTLNGTAYNSLTSFLSAAGGTFSRASTATYFDSTGTLQTSATNTPRFDYNPSTLAAKGILIEESRTNLLTYSEQLSQSGWLPYQSTITDNTVTSPSASLTGDTVTATVNGDYGYLLQQTNKAAGQAYSFSIFVKQGNVTRVLVGQQYDSGANDYSDNIFDFSSKSWTTTGLDSPTLTAIEYPNGWFRLSVTLSSVGTGNFESYVGPLNSNGTVFTDNTAGNYVYSWGAQLEQGASATSYIPTTTATATRAIDVFTIPTAGWFDTAKGTYFAEFFASTNNFQGIYTRIIGEATDARQYLGLESNFAQLSTWAGGNAMSSGFSPAASPTTSVKSAVSWNEGTTQRSMVGNTGVLATGSYTGTYNATTIRIGGSSGTSNPPNAPIKKIKYYPAQPLDAQLQLLTQ